MSSGWSRLLEALRGEPPRNAEQAADLVRLCGVSVEALAGWVAFDHPPEDGYGRRLVAAGPGFEVLLMSWRPGDWSAIHDHGRTGWGAVQVFGEAEHTTFTLRGRTLSLTGQGRVRDAVLPVDASLVHQLGNPTDAPMLSLHVYGAEGQGTDVTAGSRVFDLWAQEIQWTDGGVFHGLPESAVTRREKGLTGDAAACALHHARLLAWLDRLAARGALRPDLAAVRAQLRAP